MHRIFRSRLCLYQVAGAVAITMAPAAALSQEAATQEFDRDLLAQGLQRPEAVAPIDSQTALIAERSGRVVLVRGDSRTDLGPIEVEGAQVFFVEDLTEGLKDLILASSQGDVFLWCMNSGSEDNAWWSVGRATLRTDATGTPSLASEILWQSTPQDWQPNFPYSGCRLALDGDSLLVAMGGNDRDAGSGEIVRLSRPDGAEVETVSTGHRNPSGIIVEDGEIWEVEHGPTGGDELNLIVPGSNYGWPDVSLGAQDEEGGPGPFLDSSPDTVDPVVNWTPAIAPSGLTQWRGRLYIGGLQAEGVIVVDMDAPERPAQNLIDFGTRVRDVRRGPDGDSLWVLTDGNNAQLFRLTPRGE